MSSVIHSRVDFRDLAAAAPGRQVYARPRVAADGTVAAASNGIRRQFPAIALTQCGRPYRVTSSCATSNGRQAGRQHDGERVQ